MRPALPLALVVFTACTPRISNVGELDAGPPETLTLTGEVCTPPPDPSGFATKIVLLFDQSGSMCLTDPPGAKETPGFCETLSPPAGVTVPARVRALQRLLAQLGQQPTAQVALVPFETNVKNPWPAGGDFGRGDASLFAQVGALPGQLGNASDFQGALEFAYSLIASDVVATERALPDLLPRTRYLVLLVADGPPSPGCPIMNTAIEADDTHPELTWPDSATYCNTATPADPNGITGFVGGQDRNQNSQLFAIVDQLLALKTQYHVGDVRLNTALLFNEEAVTACGPICQDLFGTHLRWPGPTAVPGPENAAFAHAEGRWLMRELANRGGGSFSEFVDNAGVAGMSLTQFDFSSPAALTVLKRLVVQPLRATRFEGGWVPDSDGDGVPDDVEHDAGSSPYVADSDSDGFDDKFELDWRDAGFDVAVKDLRGCDPVSPLTPGCVPRDTDGDGLSQFAEAFLGTEFTLVDTDRDGFADGLEVRAGLSPTVKLDPATDTDSDGVTDAEELTRSSDPRHADRTFGEQLGSTTTVDEHLNNDGTACYSFTTRNLPMVATPGRTTTPAGLGLFRVWFVGAPQGVGDDVGFWQAACAWARRDGSVLVPADLVLDVPPPFFGPVQQVGPNGAGACAGTDALAP
jgi:hypothetical protein